MKYLGAISDNYDLVNKKYVDDLSVVAGANVSISVNAQGKREVSVAKPSQTSGDSLNGDYRLLLSNSANTSEDSTYNSYKSTYLTFNPNSSLLKIGDTSTTYSATLSGNPTYTEGLIFANSTSSTTGQYESHFGPRGLQVFNAGENSGQPDPNSTTADAQSHTVVYGGGVGVMNNSTWSTSTNGTYIFGGKSIAGSIELKDGSTTAKTITATKIDTWDAAETKVSTGAVASTGSYYPVLGSDTTSAATKYYDKTGLKYQETNGTTSADGFGLLELGNNTASGTANNKLGVVRIFGTSTSYTDIKSSVGSTAREVLLPDASGTLALTSDISSKIKSSVTGASSNLVVGRWGSSSSSGSKTITLPDNGIYLLLGGKYNNDSSNYSGAWIIAAHGTKSSVFALRTPSSNPPTVSISALTLSLTTATTNYYFTLLGCVA